MTQSILLTLKHIHVSRGEKNIIYDLSLSLHAGETIIVTGENGSGKSTLLRSIAKLCPLTHGTIYCPNTFAWLGHQNALKSSLTIRENLTLLSPTKSSNLLSTLDSLGLASLIDYPIRRLSNGQQRRAAFARIIMSNANIWLLDEPMTSIDSLNFSRIEKLITQHCQKGGGAIIVSHAALSLESPVIHLPLPLKSNQNNTV